MDEKTWYHNAAIMTMRFYAAEALNAMLLAFDACPPEEEAPPFIGCEALPCYDHETPPTPAERRCFRQALAFLGSQELSGIERKTLPRSADAGEWEPVLGEVARLTAEGARKARELLNVWDFDARVHKRQLLAAALIMCDRQAMSLDPPETPAEEAALAGCARIMRNTRDMVEVMERFERAGLVPGEREPPEISELVAWTDAGPVYEGDLWGTVQAETASDVEAIRAALEEPAASKLTEYAETCLSLGAELRGVVTLTPYAAKPAA